MKNDNLHHSVVRMLSTGLKSAFIGILLVSCGTTKNIPTNTREIVTYRDSTIWHNDTLYTHIPVELYADFSNMLDTLKLETSMAEAEAYLDTANMMLKGSIENKDVSLPVEYRWKERIVEHTDTLVVEKVVKETEVVEKTRYPKSYWYLLVFALSIIGIAGIKAYKKFFIK